MSFTGFTNPVTVSDAFRKLEILSKQYPPESKTVDTGSLEPGRVLAEDIVTDVDIPVVRTSNIDGFATIVNQLGTKRRIVGSSTAVTPYNAELKLGECVRITNGGVVPDGADTVVPFENVTLKENNLGKRIEVYMNLEKGANIEEKGSEAIPGDILLKDGQILDSISINLLHALGISQIEIYKKPRVCVMSIENGNSQDKVYGTFNRSQLLALFQIHGFKPIDAGTSSVKSREMEKNLRVAADFACVIVVTGGDGSIRKMVRKLKMTVEIGCINSDPGNFSIAYGNIDDKPVVLCMLPQDHISSWIGASVFILPLLRAMEGRSMEPKLKWKSKLTQSIPTPTQTSFIRARTEFMNDRLHSTPIANQSLLGTNSILEVSTNDTCSAGDMVDALILNFM